MPGAIAPIAGAVVGGLMGGDDGGGQQVSKDPWGPAQQPLKETLSELRALQLYQQQNPWNQIQQTGYENMFTDLDSFRGQNNALSQFANQLMGQRYTPQPRQGLLQQPMQQTQPASGLLSPGVFSIPQGRAYGAPNWKELNPYTATGGLSVAKPPAAAPAPTQDQLTQQDLERLQRIGQLFTGAGA